MPDQTDERDRGILTPTDREFLRGEKEYANPETASHRRRDIRQRVINSIRDFELLANQLSEADREKIFEELDGGDLRPVISFLFLGLEADTIDETMPAEYVTIPKLLELESVIQFGVWDGLQKMDFVPIEVNCDISPEGYLREGLDFLKGQIQEGEAGIGRQEVTALIAAGELDQERTEQFVKEEIKHPSGQEKSEGSEE